MAKRPGGSKGSGAAKRSAASRRSGASKRSGTSKQSGSANRSGAAKRSGNRDDASISRRRFVKAGVALTAAVAVTGGTGHYAGRRLNDVADFPPDVLAGLRAGRSTQLFRQFPGTAAFVPWLPLAGGATPVVPLPELAGAADVRLLIKRDDLTSTLYGGNKVRKLEHLLAEAKLLGRRTLITVGGAGTNHGLATALFGRRHGFDVHVALFHQPPGPHVRRNVEAMLAAGATLHYDASELMAARRVYRLYREARAAGRAPYFLMVGGSTRLGVVGHVNAALELAAQVRAGVLPEPDRVFVALGSCGTAAGLAAGCRLAGLKTRISAVRVTSRLIAHGPAVRYLANDTLRWLRPGLGDAARVSVGSGDVDVVTDHLGRGYGHASAAGAAAAEWLGTAPPVEPTYTAKALAACLDYCRRSARPGETVLYWHTANGHDVPRSDDVSALPPKLRELLSA